MSTRVVLHIDRLTLRGLRPADQARLVHSLRRELGRQFESPRVGISIAERGNVARATVHALRIPADAGPGQLGRQVARGIARSLCP
jgi:hypothetical protein